MQHEYADEKADTGAVTILVEPPEPPCHRRSPFLAWRVKETIEAGDQGHDPGPADQLAF
jgi:hypothetical protein